MKDSKGLLLAVDASCELIAWQFAAEIKKECLRLLCFAVFHTHLYTLEQAWASVAGLRQIQIAAAMCLWVLFVISTCPKPVLWAS